MTDGQGRNGMRTARRFYAVLGVVALLGAACGGGSGDGGGGAAPEVISTIGETEGALNLIA